MIALTTGVNQLIQGEVYALPAFPCQILSDRLLIDSSGFNYLYTATEPGLFVDGGKILVDGITNVIVKKHTIGKSGAATKYEAAVVMDKPSYYWRLNDPSGTSAYERIQGLHGTISGGVTLNQPGALVDGDKCMVFDGVSGKIQTVGTISVPLVCTIEGWVKPTVDAGLKPMFSTRSNPSPLPGTTGETFDVGLLSNLPYASPGTYAYVRTGSLITSTGIWHHLVFVFNGTTVSFYVDSVFDQAQSFVRSVPSVSPCTLCWDSGTAAGTGSLDEVAIYPYALSQGQITQHYMARSSPFIADSYASKVIASGPSNYWRLGETYGTTAVDIIGGANGTISGGVTLNGESGMTFDGINGKVTTSNGILKTPFTIEMQVKRNNNTVDNQVIFCNTFGTGDNLVIRHRGDSVPDRFSIYATPSGSGLSWASPYDTLWHHLVIVFSGGVAPQPYVDGIAAIPGDLTPVTMPAGVAKPFEFGFDSNWNAFNGFLKDIAIYPRALSATEILDHYRAR